MTQDLAASTSLPAEASVAASALRTFLIADVRGYTRFTDEHGDEAAARLATRFAALAREGVAQHGGQVLELRGDEALAVFGSARQALRAALALHGRFGEATAADPTLPLPVGMGLDAGDAVPVEGGYRGHALNLAARLCSLAGPGEVFASEGVVHLAGTVEGLAYVERGRVHLKGLAQPVRVLQVLPEGGVPASLPPLVAAVAQPSTLPAAPTPFIGRGREVAAVRERLLEPETRLLTLTGAGGTGKTRLALQVANQVLAAFPDGVYFVALAPLSDPTLVLPTIAQTLEVREADGRPLRETLHGFLHAKHLLLVLDNFEQVLEAAPDVAALLAACPQVRVLATSRAVLHLRGERLYAVPPLALPQTAPLPPLETLTQYEAVRLFIARAQDVKPNFAVTNETAPAVAEICVRLDGLPLAIELAAARVKLLAPPALLARLSKRLPLLVGGARDLPERQRTLRATIDWSYSLLSTEEQVLFARLSVFQGGRTLEAIEAVCNPQGELDVLARVEALLEKSLLQQTEVEDETRFLMLETIHEYARERLAESGEAEDLRRAHAAYFLALAEEAEPMLKGPEQGAWLDRLDREHDNLRAALQWAQDSGEVGIGLRLAAALGGFWYLQGHWSEGRRWLDALLALPAPASDPALAAAPDNRVRVAALNAAAWLAARQFDYQRARALAEESAALARSMDDVPGLIDALRVLEDEARYHRFVLDEARELGTQSVALARSIADDWRTARALLWLGCDVGEAGDPARAVALWEESEALYRACGDSDGRAYALFFLGELSTDTGQIAQAVRYLQDALVLSGTRVSSHRATTELILAEARMNQGAYREAEALFEVVLAVFRMVGSPSQVARSQTHLALLSLAQGEDRRAESLLEESLRQARAADVPFEVARALMVQGDLLMYRGLYDQADEVYRESLQLFERMQIPPAIAWVLRPYGVLAQRQGRLALARERLERGLTLLQGEWRPYYAPIPTALGRVAAEEGHLDEAERLLREGLGLERTMGRPREIAEALEGLATVTVAQGRPERAVRLSAAAAGIRASIGAPLSPYERAAFERTLDAARASLGADAVETTWTSAQAVPREQTVDEALASP